jgi:hypothetical protein
MRCGQGLSNAFDGWNADREGNLNFDAQGQRLISFRRRGKQLDDEGQRNE